MAQSTTAYKDKDKIVAAALADRRKKQTAIASAAPAHADERDRKVAEALEFRRKKTGAPAVSQANNALQIQNQLKDFGSRYESVFKAHNDGVASALWGKETAEIQALQSANRAQVQSLMQEAAKYRQYWGNERTNQIIDSLWKLKNAQTSIYDNAELYSQYKDESEFQRAIAATLAQQKEEEELLGFNIELGEKEIYDLELQKEAWEKEYDQKVQAVQPYTDEYWALEDERRSWDEQINEKKQYLEKAREFQSWKQQSDYYAGFKNNPDWVEKSKYKATGYSAGKYDWVAQDYTGGTGDINYEVINGMESTKAVTSDPLRVLIGEDGSQLNHMTPDEVETYNYLYDPNDKTASDTYLEFLVSTLNYRRRKDEEQQMAKMAQESPVASSAVSILISPLKAATLAGQIGDYVSTGKIDQNAGYNRFSYESSAVRQQVAADIATSGKWGEVGSWTYNLGMSMGDFLMNTAVSGGNQTISLALMGSGAMADTVIAAKDRGLSDDQAFTLGVVAGAAEIVTEKFSLDALFKGGASKGAVRYILKNAFTEGTEEVSSSLINLVADTIVAKDKSQWEMAIQAYLDEHPDATKKEAEQKVLEDELLSLGLDFLGGVVMGGAMGSAGAGINAISANIAENQNAKALYGGVQQELVGEALEINPDNTYAQKMQGRLDKGKDLSGKQLNRLVQQNDTAQIQSTVESRLTELGETGDVAAVAKAVAKQAAGEKLTRAEQKLIAGSKYASQVTKELRSNKINLQEDGGLTEAAQKPQEGTGETSGSLPQSAVLTAPSSEVAEGNPPVVADATPAPFRQGGLGDAEVDADPETVAENETFQKSTGKVVEVKRFSSVGKDTKIVTQSGDDVKLSDVSVGNENEALLLQTVPAFEHITTEAANEILHSYRLGTGNVSSAGFIAGAAHVFKSGYYNSVPATEYSSRLTDTQRNLIYAAGRKAAQEEADAAQAARDAQANGGVDRSADKDYDGHINSTTRNTVQEDNRNERQETRDAFHRRAHEKVYTVRERGQIAYGYTPVADQAGSAGQVKRDLQKLGIQVIVHEGLEFNVNGITRTILGDATSVVGDVVYVRNSMKTEPMETVGHEAYHFWKNTEARSVYEETIQDNIIFSSEPFIQFQKSIEDIYFDKEVGIEDDGTDRLVEEIFAYITGIIHAGDVNNAVRPFLRDYNAVKAAWDRMIKQQTTTAEAKAARAEAAPAPAKKGGVFRGYDGQRISKNSKGLTKKQRISVDFTERLAKRFGATVYFYESYVDENGKKVYKAQDGSVKTARKGFYNPKDGSVHIDLNGDNLLFTVSHELVHFIKDWSPAQFRKMADVIMAGFGKQGITAEELIANKQAEYAEDGIQLTEDEAFEEVIAASLEGIMADGRVMELLQKLEAEDKGLKAKVKKFFQDIGRMIRDTIDSYRGVKPDSAEGRLIQKMEDICSQLQELFAEGLYDAGETFRKTENTTGEGGVRYSIERTQSMSWADQIDGALYGGKNVRRNDTLVVGSSLDTSVGDAVAGKPLAIPLSVLSKAINGKDVSHSIRRGKLAKLDQGIQNAPITIINPSRNAIVYVTNIKQGGLPIVVAFDMNAVFDGDAVHKATSIHLQVNVDSMLQNLPESATIFVKENELDPVGATNNLRGLAAKIKFIDGNVSQVNRIVNKNFTTDSDKEPGVRYSVGNNTDKAALEMVEKENAKLREDVAQLKELLRLQGKQTHGTKFTASSVEAAARYLKKNAGAKGDTKALAKMLNEFYEYIALGEDLTWETLREKARPIAEWLMDHVELTGTDLLEYEQNWRLNEQNLIRDVYDSYWRVNNLRTVADRNAAQMNKLKFQHFQRIDKLKADNRANVEQLKEQHRAEVKFLRNAFRQNLEAQQKELLAEYRKQRKEDTENREKTIVRHKIQRVVGELNDLLLSNDKKRHVPDSLKKAVANALSLVNMDTVGADARVAKYAALIATETDPDKIDAYTVTMENILRQGEKMAQRLTDLRNAYEEVQGSDDPDIANAYDPVIAGSLKELAESIGDTSLRDMTIDQLQDVYDMYKMVLTRVRDANKAFIKGRVETISSLANTVIDEIKKVGGTYKERVSSLDPVKKFDWDNLKPVYAFERIGSGALADVFNSVRAGEDVWAVDITEAKKYYLDRSKKYGYDSWDLEQRHRFKSTSGQEFELTLDQIMSLYAYSKRDKALDHLYLGGFVFDSNIETHKEKEIVDKKDGKVKRKKSILKYKVNTADAHQLNTKILSSVSDTLTKEQRAFVDEMQEYLSKVMGAKGNEVTMAMYGVKLFKEEFYFPLKTAKQFLYEQNEVAGEVKIKNSGFTNKTTPQANNPVILNNFMDVWANHVNDMSMYHAFVLPLEDFNRIFNYSSPTQEGLSPVSVKGTIQNAYGPSAVGYVKQLITDLNGGAVSDPRETFAKAMTAKFKKAKVFSSLSVIIQQPSAIGRAFALIDPKYFRPTKDGINHDQLWGELKQYAPVAVIKEMGFFDTNMGRSTLDYIKAKEYSGIKEMTKGFVIDSSYRDEVLSRLPALADEVTWCAIWNAVKRETIAKHHDLSPKSDAFLKIAGERFTDVIIKTQVYDSVLARSANTRSKSGLMSMITSFMAEPTTTINMIEDAILKAKRGNKKYAARAVASVMTAIVLNNALVALVYAARDDDEDETFIEKYLAAFVSNMVDDINPITYYPYLKDLWSIFQGYDVERSDVSLFSDLADSAKALVQAYDSDNGDVANAWWNLTGTVSNLFGIPIENISRELRGAINFVDTISSNQRTTWGSLGDSLADSIKDAVPVWGWIPDDTKADKLYKAIISGDTVYVNRLKSGYKDQNTINTAIRKGLRENDPRIRKAAIAWNANNLDEYMSIAKEIIAEKHFIQDDVVMAIRAEASAIAPDDASETKSRSKGLFTAEKFAEAVSQGDAAMANAIKTDIIMTEKKNGKTAAEAENTFKNSAKSELKDLYLVCEISRDKVVNALVTYCGIKKGDAMADVQYWDFKQDHLDVFADDAWIDEYYSEIEESGISIEMFVSYRNKVKGITGENKKADRLAVIHSLPISNAQKDALYYAEGWAASKIHEAPWH